MRAIGKDRTLRRAYGFGVVPALAVLLAVSLLCVWMVTAALTSPDVSQEQLDREQAYLSAVSAARLLREVFGQDSSTHGQDSPADRQDNLTHGQDSPTHGQDSHADGQRQEAFDFTAARAILRRLDETAKTDGGYIQDTLTLERTGYDAAALNGALSVPVRFIRTSSGTVTASICAAADFPADRAVYPVTLSLPVYTAALTCTTYRADGTADTSAEVNRGTYPAGYPPAAAAEDLRQGVTPPEAADYDYTCTYDAGAEADGGPDIPPVKLWKILWQYQWEGGAGTETRKLASLSMGGGDEPPAEEEIERPDTVPALPASPGDGIEPEPGNGMEPEAGKAWVFLGWPDYPAYTVSLDDKTVTVTGRFEQWDRRRLIWVAWADSAGTVLGSADYAVNPANSPEAVWFDSLADGHPLHPQTPDRSTEYDTCTFREWREIGTTWQDGIPVTTMRAMYAVTAKRNYTVRWLDGGGSVLDEAAAEAGQPEPVTDKTPVRTEADQFFPFLYWDDGTMEGGTAEVGTAEGGTAEVETAEGGTAEGGMPVKVYRPRFGPGQARHTFVWVDGRNHELLRLEYGDNAPSDEEAAALGPASADSVQPPESNGYYHYQFLTWSGWRADGWTKTKTPVYNTARPVADRNYTILWLDGDGMELASRTATAGHVEPAPPSTPAGFTGWDMGTMGTEQNPSIKVYWPR